MYSQFSDKFPDEFSNKYKTGVRKAFHILWDKKRKYFVSDAWTIGEITVRCNTAPMPRWAWAWMFAGLCRLKG